MEALERLNAMSPIDWSFVGHRRVLVTGHTGFKGSWFTLWLLHLGAEVVGYSLPPASPGLFEASGMQAEMTHIEADIRDFERLRQVVEHHRPHFVFHFAAQPIVRRSYGTPLETLDVNVMGTANLLESVRRSGISCVVVVVSSDKCYRNRDWAYGYREEDELGGYDVYSASKGCAEIVASSWRRSFFAAAPKPGDIPVRVATGRAGNVIGGGDWSEDRLIPDCVRSLSGNRPVSIRNPKAVRPWQHVLEPLYGYLMLAYRMAEQPGNETFLSAWNFGPEMADACSVESVVRRFIRLWGKGEWVAEETSGAVHEAATLRLSIEKARMLLGWRPIWKLDTALEKTASWYRAYYAGQAAAMKEISLQQIREFQTAVSAHD